MRLEELDQIIDLIRSKEREQGIERKWDIESHGDEWCVSGATADGRNRETRWFPSQSDAIYVVGLLRWPHSPPTYEWDSEDADAASNARLEAMLLDLTRAVVRGSRPR